jgi:hypothetical protein
MGTATSTLVKSKFFLPIFNMAIFDGPFRLYFAQTCEPEALRMYFELHELLGDRIRPPRSGAQYEKALFVLLYPDEATYANAFQTDEPAVVASLGDFDIVGVKGAVWDDSVVQLITDRIDRLFDNIPADRPFEVQAF